MPFAFPFLCKLNMDLDGMQPGVAVCRCSIPCRLFLTDSGAVTAAGNALTAGLHTRRAQDVLHRLPRQITGQYASGVVLRVIRRAASHVRAPVSSVAHNQLSLILRREVGRGQ